MKPMNLLASCAAAALVVAIAAGPVLAQKGEQIYGSQLMTEQERQQFRDRMRSAESASERERIRREHHERMKARAKEKGVSLPDEPPMQGMGRGPGMGSGGGMGGMGGRGR